VIADRLAAAISPWWGAASPISAAESWAAVLGYTFQIYFDFSGYSDIAVGLAHLFGFRLPQNFDSPYKAADPIDFWPALAHDALDLAARLPHIPLRRQSHGSSHAKPDAHDAARRPVARSGVGSSSRGAAGMGCSWC
jgi:hypothetical protein